MLTCGVLSVVLSHGSWFKNDPFKQVHAAEERLMCEVVPWYRQQSDSGELTQHDKSMCDCSWSLWANMCVLLDIMVLAKLKGDTGSFFQQWMRMKKHVCCRYLIRLWKDSHIWLLSRNYTKPSLLILTSTWAESRQRYVSSATVCV